MNLIKIQSLLHEYSENGSNDIMEHLEKIHKHSYNYLQSINQKFKYPYADDGLWHLFVHSETTYKTRTIEGYHCSWIRSGQLLDAENKNVHELIIREWEDDIDRCLDGKQKMYKASQKIYFYWLQKRGEGEIISLHEYRIAKKTLYNQIADYLNSYLDNVGEYNKADNPFITELVLEEIKNLLDEINRLDKNIGIENIYGTESQYWQDFHHSAMLLKWIAHTATRHGGGRPPKIVKDLQIKRNEFCKDINKCLKYGKKNPTDYLKDNLISTYELSKVLLDGNPLIGDKYSQINNPDIDGLNKFIRSIFELEWLKHEELLPIFKFNSDYYLYLPKN